MTAGQPPRSDLLHQLASELDLPRTFVASYQLPKAGLPSRPCDLLDALGLQTADLSDMAKATLAALGQLGEQTRQSWLDFRWKLSAFQALQDIFDCPLGPGGDLRIIFQQYYFYYESALLLAECVLAGLNGLYTASDSLLRPFLEFSLLQNYFHRLSTTGSYRAVEHYFATAHAPARATLLKGALPDDAFCRPIKFRCKTHLEGLSESTQHPYHPQMSPLQHRRTRHGHSFEGIFFWQKIHFVLDAALWVYYANFPALFHPVDVLRKFGFNTPLGILVDFNNAELVRRSLNVSDYHAFKSYAEQQETTATTLAWARERPDLSDEEIAATWAADEARPPDLQAAYAEQVARLRAIRVALAFRAADESSEVPDDFIDSLWTLQGWSKLGRRK
jgi:hypothetical protein